MMQFTGDKPSTIPEIFDTATGLYRRNFARLVATGGVLLFPAGLVMGLAQIGYQVVAVGVIQGGARANPAGFGLIATVAAALLAVVSVYGVVAIFARGVLIVSAAHLHLGERLSVRQALAYTWKRALALIVTEYLVGLAVGIGTLLFIIPGIAAGIFFSMAGAAVLIEDLSLFDAMARSIQLVRGHPWRVLLVLTAASALVAVLQSIVTVPGQLIVLLRALQNPEALLQPTASVLVTGVQGLLSAIALAVVTPVQALLVTGLFVDLRLRREGEDLLSRVDALR